MSERLLAACPLAHKLKSDVSPLAAKCQMSSKTSMFDAEQS